MGTNDKVWAVARKEWTLATGVATGLIFVLWGDEMLQGLSSYSWLAFLFIWLFSVVLASALGVVRHAEHLAQALGEPYGTLVLTLSITSIEVMSITAVMLHGEANPTLVRDTLFSVVMIILGAMVGLSLLLGALRHREQYYNLQGANAYLGVIVLLATLSLILPTFANAGVPGSFASVHRVMLIVMALLLYGTFLVLQTGRNRGYFVDSGEAAEAMASMEDAQHRPGNIRGQQSGHVALHAALLIAYMVPVVFLVEELAVPIDYVIETLHAPKTIGGVVMAVLVATPEAIGAIEAALSNHLQRSVNIFLGSVLSTIGLTVPLMLIVGFATGHVIILGLRGTDMVLLLLALATSIITFASGRTNVMQGAIHILLFTAFVFLLF